MNRRTFLGTLAGSLLATPLVAQAQQAAKVFKIGVITEGGSYSATLDGLRNGLRELRFEEGKQFVLVVRDTKGDLVSVEAAARSLEAEPVDLLYTVTTSVTIAAKRATKRVPIVFYVGGDPVDVGLVQSFRKPGGRLTGVYGRSIELTAKRLELLKQMIPTLRRVVTFYNPNNPTAVRSLTFMREAARQLKIDVAERPVASVAELRASLDAFRPGDADAFVHVSDAMVTSQLDLVVGATKAKRLPTMFSYKDAVVKGALASYGESYYALGRLSANQVKRVLQGAEPGSIPVEQLDRPQFCVNLKTAKALGLAIPAALLVRADEVIQ